MKLWRKLNQPYPFLPYRSAVYRDLFFAAFLSLFLVVFKPFGLDVYHADRIHFILGYGVIGLAVALVNDSIGYTCFPGVFNESRWTLGRQLLWMGWHLFSMGIADFVYAASIEAFPWSIEGFAKIQCYVLLCGLIPVYLFTVVHENYILKRNRNEADAMENHRRGGIQTEQPERAFPDRPIILTGENRNEQLTIKSTDFCYACSQDNYVQVIYRQGEKTNRILLRTTLSRLEEQLAGFPELFRCHRSYIVNASRIVSVTGNAQGYLVAMDTITEKIPVARSRGKELHHLLKKTASAAL